MRAQVAGILLCLVAIAAMYGLFFLSKRRPRTASLLLSLAIGGLCGWLAAGADLRWTQVPHRYRLYEIIGVGVVAGILTLLACILATKQLRQANPATTSPLKRLVYFLTWPVAKPLGKRRAAKRTKAADDKYKQQVADQRGTTLDLEHMATELIGQGHFPYPFSDEDREVLRRTLVGRQHIERTEREHRPQRS